MISERAMLQSRDYGDELGFFLRSGSAPPTVEGSLSAAGGLFSGGGGGVVSEEELRADPAYVSYYYANVNMNPRLPPPLVSKEEWRLSGGGVGGSGLGGIGDRRKGAFPGKIGFRGEEMWNELGQGAREWGGDGLIGLPGLGLGSRHKSIAEIIQEDISHTTSVTRHPSHSPADSQTYASALSNSMSKSITPDPRHVPRVSSPHIPPVGSGRNCMEKRTVPSPNLFNDVSAGKSEPDDLVAALSGTSLSTNGVVDKGTPAQTHQNYFPFRGDQKGSQSVYAGHSYRKGSFNPVLNSGGNLQAYSNNLEGPNSFRNYGLNGYAVNPASPSKMGSPTTNLPPLFEDAASVMGISGLDSRALGRGLAFQSNLISPAAELQNFNRTGNHNIDPAYLQYLRTAEFSAATFNDPAMNRAPFENSYTDLLQKAYLEKLLLSQKSHHGLQHRCKSGNLNHNYFGTPDFGVNMYHPALQNSQRNIRYPSGLRNLAGCVMGQWHPEACGNLEERFMPSLLDEFKSNKTRCFELSEIVGHVVEFSADQYGSRFIQQKLETATAEEIKMVFDEIMPQALCLMTDVFGNYVIQKFFEHGTASQIRELANQLIGHVLTLSLQMYGCRVIQKAIEVVELDQQKEMVAELDGHIMRCIRDQNGNHVIQKCIECIPEDAIQFVISVFYDQVVTLSTHPYGCRVIQRVLEHCRDPKTQSKVMDEIMKSICMLTQDQYGNYVVQHVLEHGKPEERTAIIDKLIGQIVQMSQQKFASNVVEKCLTFGTSAERQTLVNEMLGSNDENEPLQVMMKDQFANYVVQKVLETCDDNQLESILNRIKVHLNALKKYTYGKHIVARVEKLVVAGERRISGLTASYSASTV